MNAPEILAALLRSGAELRIQDGRLTYRVPKGTIVPAIRDELVAHKAEVTALLEKDVKYLLCSFAQERLWFLYQLEPASPIYNMAFAFHLRDRLDVDALAHSLRQVVRRHETLRTTFVAFEDLPVQVVHSALDFQFSLLDLSGWPEQGRQAELDRQITQETQQPFDLTRGPLLRVTLFRLGDENHVLLLDLHHIVIDGWSMDVLWRDMMAFYIASMAGRPAALPELTVQYTTFSQWQRQYLQGATLEEQIAYWKQRLAGAPAVLELPTDHPRPSIQTHNGAIYRFRLPQTLTQAVQALSQREGVTMFMTLLAAFQALLFRYTHQPDIVVGSPIANRTLPELEDLIGFFVNTLLLRTDLRGAGNPTVRELLRHVRQVTLEAYEHQDLPFEKLVEALHPERSLSHTPLFQVMFVYQNTPKSTLEASGLVREPCGVDNLTSKFDIDLMLEEYEGQIACALNYNTDLFELDTIRRMAARFEMMLDGMASHPEQHLADIPILMPDERQKLVVEWANTHISYPDVPCLHQLFERQVERTPDTPAVVFESQQYTYRELNQRANQVAHHLQRLGVGPDVRVGLWMEKSLDILAALFGILKAGGAYVPLDPIYPPERIHFMLEDVQVTALVTQSDLAATLPSLEGKQIVCLDGDRDLIARHSVENPPICVTSSNLFYVLFTSGSTGRPKGVAVEHRNYLNYYHGVMSRLQVSPGMHYAMVSTFSTDLGTIQFWAPLTTGGTTHIIAYERATDPDGLVEYLRRHPIDVLKLVPSHYDALQGASSSREIVPRHLVIFTGEPSHWDTVSRVKMLNPACIVQDHYGVTETTCATLVYETPSQPPPDHAATLPLGSPLGNVRVHTLDAKMEPTPLGIPGELCIAGSGVTRGYWGRPDLTAERFVPDPYSRLPGARLYRTGDLAYYRADGSLKLLGRMDHQIKIRGYRIEAGEIETSICQHPAVQDAVVIAREDTPGDRRLVAYLALRPEQVENFSASALREHLRERLPDYMVPAALVVLDKIPLNPNGKVDRFALPVPEYARLDSDAFVAPRNELEVRIAAAWTEVLGVDQIGIDDNFFELGGESFKAIRAVRKIGASVSVLDLFKGPTIRQLARQIAQGHTSTGLLHELTSPVPQRDRRLSLVCVPYGGGSAVVYQPLANALPKNCSLYAVALPGHDYSRREEALQTLTEVARQCAEEIQRTITGPLVLYGHCVGGALAIEMAHQLEQAGRPVTAVVLGATFPAARLPGKLFEWLDKVFPSDRRTSSRSIYEMLRVLGGFTDAVDPQEQEFVLYGLRHDVRQAEDYYTDAYAQRHHCKLKAPILCIVGQMDRATEFYEERSQEWAFFGDAVELAVIEDAGHYFLKHQPNALARIITNHVLQRPSSHGLAAARRQVVQGASAQKRKQNQLHRQAAPSLLAFFIVTFGQLISLIGTGLTGFALGVWVFQQTRSVAALSYIQVLALLPGILILPITGALADRWDRRWLMIVSDVMAACGILTLALLLWAGWLQIWHLFIVTSVSSVANALRRPAYLAAITQLVPKHYLGQANGIAQLGGATSNLLAPLLGGVLVVTIGLHGIVLIDCATFLFAITATLLVRFPHTMFRKREEPFWQEVTGGWHYITRRHSLVAMVIFFVIFNYLLSIVNVLITPLVLSFGSASNLGLVGAASGAGVLAGGLVMGVWGGTRRRAEGMVGFAALFGLSVMVIGLQPVLICPIIGFFGFGFSLAIINAHWLALIQLKVGLELQGRVLSMNQMMGWSMMPLGFLSAGPLTDLFEPLMAPNGRLASSLGALIGAGPGRGMGAIMLVAGIFLVILTTIGYRYRPLRYMDDLLPDAIPDAVISADKDELQKQADQQLLAEAI